MANRILNASLFRIHMTSAARRVKKTLAISLINIVCLSFGIAGFLLITLYVINEYNFNRNYSRLDRLARVTTTFKSTETGQTDNLAYALPTLIDLLKDHPQIEKALGVIIPEDKVPVQIDGRTFYEGKFLRTQSGYFGLFNHTMIEGDTSKALDQPNSIVMTESLARKYFGQEKAIGKELKIETEQYIVTGVIEDIPANVDLRFDALLTLTSQEISSFSDWAYVFLLLHEHSSKNDVQQFIDAIYDSDFKDIMAESHLEGKFTLEMLSEMHFGPEYQGDSQKGNRLQLVAFQSIGVVILLISLINYINISISQSVKRNPEIGIRKIFGASARGIILQCAAESLTFIFAGVVLAIGIYYWLNPEMANIIGYQLALEGDNIIYVAAVLLLIVPLLTVLAGIYQAVFFSNVNPLAAVRSKNENRRSNKIFGLANVLLFIQLSASITLIVSSLIISRQISLLTEAVPGFDKDQVVIIDLPVEVTEQQAIGFKNDIAQLSEVSSTSFIGKISLPTSSPKHFDVYSVDGGGEEKTRICSSVKVSKEYCELLKISVVHGRDFTDRDFTSDSTQVILVNEALVETFGISNPIGQTIKYGSLEHEIIGVVKDFNDNGLQKRVESLILFPLKDPPEALLIKADKVSQDFIGKISDVWENAIGGSQMEFDMLDKKFFAQFRREAMMQRLTAYFSSLAVVIAFAGLFSVTMLDLKRKVMPFTVRKIFGAGLWDMTWAAGRMYVMIFGLAVLISVPILFIWMQEWLNHFKYKASIGLHVILPVIGLIGLVILFIVFLQVRLVTRKNSLEGLRND
ncbi:MAG: ABC transporter permease [Cyclobacteriaceae bacterium]